MEPSDRTWEELVADGAASLNRASLVPARNRPTRFSSSSSSSSGEGSSLLPPRKLQQLCTSKQAWQTAALIFIPLIFNQLGSVMSHYSDWALASPPPLHAPPGARQQLTLVTLASILERSPLFFFFFSSWWVDLAVLLALIALFRFMSSPACTAASPSPKESGFRSRWGTVLHAFSFFSALFNLRQSSAIVGTVFMLLASTAKGRADTIERDAHRLAGSSQANPFFTRLLNTMWWALIFGTTDIAFLLPHLACLFIAYSFFSSEFRFKYATGVAICFLMFPLLLVISYMMDTVYRSILHFAFAPRSVVFSRYFSSDVMLNQSISFIYNVILTAKLSAQ